MLIRICIALLGLMLLSVGALGIASKRLRYTALERNRARAGGRLLPSAFPPLQQQRNAARLPIPGGLALVFLGIWVVLSALWPNPVSREHARILDAAAVGCGLGILTYLVLMLVPWWGLERLRPIVPAVAPQPDVPRTYDIAQGDPTCSVTVRCDPAYPGFIGWPKVYINQVGAGRLSSRRALRVELLPGHYTIRVAMKGDLGSAPVGVEIVAGRHAVLNVRPIPYEPLDFAHRPGRDGYLSLTLV